MSTRAISGLALFAVFATAGIAHADEIRLKDGTKINGTIVGYENDSFKVETPYGFALVRKDKVAEIIPSAPKKEPEPKIKPEAVSTPPVPAPPPPTVAPPKVPATAPAATNNPIASPVAKPAAPPAPPPPPVIRDDVRGNLYVNHTYGFQMYKPPSWDLIPAARKALPDAVAALGTSDETTLLVIGLKHTTNSLETNAAATEKSLSEIYENYRSISGRRTTIALSPAIERRARGTVDGHDWSVILLTFAHGSDVYTLLGMTWADSDLIQVQENVINKAVNSLTFVAQ